MVEFREGTTRSVFVGLAAAVLTLTAAFFLVFPVAGLVAIVGLGSLLLGVPSSWWRSL